MMYSTSLEYFNFQLQTCIALFLKQQILLKEENTSQLEVTICILLDF